MIISKGFFCALAGQGGALATVPGGAALALAGQAGGRRALL